MIKKYCGILSMPERDLNDIDYILTHNRYGQMNITSLLKDAYVQSKNNFKYYGMTIMYKDRDIFNEIGLIYNYHGLWFINGVSIDETIWNLTREFITVVFDYEPEGYLYE